MSQPVNMITETSEKLLKVSVLRSRTLKRVIYLECGKDFADILLSLLTMPVGAILKVLDEAGLARDINKGLSNLYASLKNLEQSTLHVQKNVLLNPWTSCSPQMLCVTGSTGNSCINPPCQNPTSLNQLCDDCEIVTWFKCNNCQKLSENAVCTACYSYHNFNRGRSSDGSMSVHVDIVQEKPLKTSRGDVTESPHVGLGVGTGFVKENITFMIKEDLSIIKSSTITSMSLLQSTKVSNFHDLDTREIRVGRKEGLLLVRAALLSSQPLTDVFESFF